jgi:glutamate synthase domain-containing protein 2
VLTAQLHRFPRLDDEPVDTAVTIGPAAARPLHLQIPIFVSDMSFGAISAEAKTALARGAEGAGTAICSGEGGMLPEEQAECTRYLYELASGRFGWDEACLDRVQALHLKLGQGAKTGTGGHLPGAKVVGRIAEVRGLPEGTPAVSPARFTDWTTLLDARAVVDRIRSRSDGIPVGVKMSGPAHRGRPGRRTGPRRRLRDPRRPRRRHGCRSDDLPRHDQRADHGRAGPGPAAPGPGRRARRHAGGDRRLPAGAGHVKALALGADAIAVSNVALQAIGCVGCGPCHTDNCPMGIATQKPHLRARLPVQRAAEQLHPVPRGDHGADGGAGQGVRARLALPLHAEGPDQLEAGRRRAGRRLLRRGGAR